MMNWQNNNQIQGLVESIRSALHITATVPPTVRYTRWNNNNLNCTILNVDGNCNGLPIRTGFGGLLRTNSGSYISGFSGRITLSDDILFVELTTLYQGLMLAINLNYNELACYSLIKEDSNHFHVYAVLIQNIKDIISSRNFSLHHSLREGNQCAYFMAKHGASNDADLFIHSYPPEGLLPLLQSDELGTLFLRR